MASWYLAMYIFFCSVEVIQVKGPLEALILKQQQYL